MKIKRKYLKRTLIVLGIILGLLFTAILLFNFFFEEKVKSILLNKINEQLNTEITVEEIKIDLFHNFPYSSLSFHKVEMKDAIPDSIKGNLFEAENVYLQFSIFDIITGNYDIKRIECENGYVKAMVYENGEDNYHFLKEKTDTTTTDDSFNFDINKLVVKNIGVFYDNIQEKQSFSARIEVLYLKGDFNKDKYKMSIDGEIFLSKIQNQEKNFLSNQNIDISLELGVDNTKDMYSVKDGGISFHEMNVFLDGSMIYNDSMQFIDIRIEGNDIGIQTITENLPQSYQHKLRNYEIRGNINLFAELKGELTNNQTPQIRMDFNVADGYFKEKNTDIELNKLNIIGTYNNNGDNDLNNDILSIKTINFILGETDKISGNFSINGFKHPKIDCEIDATVDLAMLKDFVSNEEIETLSGRMDIKFTYSGKINDINKLSKQDFINSETEGQIQLTGVDFKLKDYNYLLTEINGKYSFNKQDIIINETTGMLGGTDFRLKGSFLNILTYFFVENTTLDIKAELFSEHVRIEEFLLKESSFSSKEEEEYELLIDENINLDLDLNIKTVSFRNFYADNMSGRFLMKNKRISFNRLSFESMGGVTKAMIKIQQLPNNNIKTYVSADLYNLEIKKLFHQLENLGLTVMTEKNIEGKTKAKIEFSALWTNDFIVDESSIVVNAEIEINNGKLSNYKPLEGLQSYIKEDLSEISFKKLNNTILIKDKIITIPKMTIESSAMDFEISGTHTFTNEIDYHLQILLSDLKLTNKAKKDRPKEEFGPIEDDGLGKTSLFVYVYGTVDEPLYKLLDKQKLKEKIKEDIQEEKQSLKEVLNEEFGWFKNDTSLHKNPEEKQTQTEFIIEWEEEDE
jgi:AsmA-like C-terminal region